MLLEIRIKNFAIIEEISLSLDEGLTVLTGETGAGKSIIIDAISLLMGARGSHEFVRHGCERAEIEGLFQVGDQSSVLEVLQQQGIEVEEGMMVLSRSISLKGKNICRLNGKLVTLGMLREIGQRLVDIHGQHENQDLMKPERHRPLLDLYAGSALTATLTEYKQLYKKRAQLKSRLRELSENEQETAQRIDLLRFQLNDIQSAQLQPGESAALEKEKQQLANFEQLFHALQQAYNALYGEHKGLDWTGLATTELESIASLDSTYKTLHQTVLESHYALEEASYAIRQTIDQLEHDPDRLNTVEARLQEIQTLQRKYGATEDDILAYASSIEEELETLEHKDAHIEGVQTELAELEKDMALEAQQMTDIRKRHAHVLENAIHDELKAVYMEKTTFKVEWKPLPSFDSNGMDRIEFFISTNPGEPLKPLVKVASGGELSRMMLAIKSIFSKLQKKTAIVFDEVDSGVSGRVAQAMAEKIYQLARTSQVICISHLPQVAAMADQHLYISKRIDDDRTATGVRKLQEDEAQNEISRMIAGTEVTELTKKHASELLALADVYKNNV
ncbi:DNA repair protein RecN [Bacillaceae bacterium SIJ1]|uniref:DNA repair protein RecN n=1 Tax=Litoribacterium kuwaitense TaxID=1398745 RepID=UPI0013ED1D7D|nr:DNA repair protein RecN [Litoribacterium kuwaitense]NGP43616.1 DNA repair protein RecN [Litoribacterium kuwaitense]